MKTQHATQFALTLLITTALACTLSGTSDVPVDATATFNAILTQANATAKANQPTGTAVAAITVVAPTNTAAPATNTNPPPTFTSVPPTFTNVPPTFTSVPPTATFTPAPPTATFTPQPPTATLTPTKTNTPGGLIIIPVIPIFPLPIQQTVTLSASSFGAVYSPPATVVGVLNVGDDEANRSRQGFITFNLGSIPASGTISEVKLDIGTGSDQLGNPFGALGCLRVYQQNYGTLDASDFVSGSALGALWRFCSTADLASATAQKADASGNSAVQGRLAAGTFQIRVQFNETITNNNGIADMHRIGTPKLTVVYTP